MSGTRATSCSKQGTIGATLAANAARSMCSAVCRSALPCTMKSKPA
jgi:hypothetical protein